MLRRNGMLAPASFLWEGVFALLARHALPGGRCPCARTLHTNEQLSAELVAALRRMSKDLKRDARADNGEPGEASALLHAICTGAASMVVAAGDDALTERRLALLCDALDDPAGELVEKYVRRMKAGETR